MVRAEPKSRTPLARMLVIHRRLVDGKYPNCRNLAQAIEVSTKTIQRDLEYMRDQLGLPMEYDRGRRGYCYTEPVTHFPTIPATEGEVLALFVAQKALEAYRGTPFEQPLAHAFKKLARALDDDISVDLDALAQGLSFRHTGVAVINLEIFQVVTRAIMEHRELAFLYRKLNGARPEKRNVQPYHLASIDGQWYVFAHDLARKDLRTFVLGRIQEVPVIGETFPKSGEFSLTDCLMGAFGVITGEGRHTVRIAFDAFAAQLVRERVWHVTQDLRELPDGELEMVLQLSSLEEIERWVLSWGGHARVIGPARLRQRIREALREIDTLYREMPPWFAELHEAAQAHQPDRLLQLVLGMDRIRETPGQLQLGLDP